MTADGFRAAMSRTRVLTREDQLKIQKLLEGDRQTMTINEAMILAAKWHKGQTREGGQAYVVHLMRVVSHVLAWCKQYGFSTDATEGLVVVALLHDVFEDTTCPVEEVKPKLQDWQWEAIDALTRRRTEARAEYMDRVCLNTNAAIVKRADILDNMNDDPRKGMSVRYEQDLRKVESVTFVTVPAVPTGE